MKYIKYYIEWTKSFTGTKSLLKVHDYEYVINIRHQIGTLGSSLTSGYVAWLVFQLLAHVLVAPGAILYHNATKFLGNKIYNFCVFLVVKIKNPERNKKVVQVSNHVSKWFHFASAPCSSIYSMRE